MACRVVLAPSEAGRAVSSEMAEQDEASAGRCRAGRRPPRMGDELDRSSSSSSSSGWAAWLLRSLSSQRGADCTHGPHKKQLPVIWIRLGQVVTRRKATRPTALQTRRLSPSAGPASAAATALPTSTDPLTKASKIAPLSIEMATLRLRISTVPPLAPLKALFLVAASSRTIADLKAQLVHDLGQLRGVASTQLLLEVDGWELLDGSQVELVREGDVIRSVSVCAYSRPPSAPLTSSSSSVGRAASSCTRERRRPWTSRQRPTTSHE
jgi:hypothetical protein